MSKAALSLVTLVVALALQGCIIAPLPGYRYESGAAPRQVTPNFTTRAKLLEKAGEPEVRTPDERFFLYENIGNRDWNLCAGVLVPNSPTFCGGSVGTHRWDRWVFIEFDENGVVKNEIIKECENKVCGSAQAAFLAVLEERYSPTLAVEYRRALQQADTLSQAVREGDVQAVKELLEAGADANARYAGGRTALHIAVSQGNTALAEQLLAGGADVNSKDKDGLTPLLLVSQNDTEMVALFHAYGGPDISDEQRRMLRRIAGEWHGHSQRYHGRGVNVWYVFKANGAFEFAYDWNGRYGSGHVEQQPPGRLHMSGEELEYKDAEGLLWTFSIEEDTKGRRILHVHSQEATWTLEQAH